MPTTSSGDTVYAPPDDMEEYVQTDANQFSLSTTGNPSQWREFLEKIQSRMKDRIDEYCGRDFEDHAGETKTFNGGPTASRYLTLPTPVRSISEVRVNGEALAADKYVRDGSKLIRVDPDDNAAQAEWPAGYQNIEVDLDWGYQTPPPDVVEAELKLVAHTVTGLAQMREGMIVQQDDVDVQVQLPEAMTPEIKNMLRKHRESGRVAGVI